VLLAFAWLFLLPLRRRPEPAPQAASPKVNHRAAQGAPTSSPQTSDIARFIQEEDARRAELDRTVWAPEIDALRHEAVIVRHWDALRADARFERVDAAVEFGVLRIGNATLPDTFEHGIRAGRFEAPGTELDRAAWTRQLQAWRVAGWRLEQSEWRHARFVPAQGARAARSVFWVALHALQEQPERRLVIRGELEVQWRSGNPQARDGANGPNAAADEIAPVPEVIDATRLEWLARAGETPFHHVVAADITPSDPAAALQEMSLMLYDLDADGRSEIVLPRHNRVFWNRGQGTFRPAALFESGADATVHAALCADFDGDGHADIAAADRAGLLLFSGGAEGCFTVAPRRIWVAREPLPNPFVLTAGDIDLDGDLDLWLAQYKVPFQDGQMPTPYYDANDGHPSYLLANDGRGGFDDRTAEAGLAAKRQRRTYSSSFVDIDGDVDLDLVVVSDFAGVDIHLNQGAGHFRDATAGWIEAAHAFGMAHSLADFDGDARLDLFVVGMNSFAAGRLEALGLGRAAFPGHQRFRRLMTAGNLFLVQREGRLLPSVSGGATARSGWSWGVASGDWDNDGDVDLCVVNGHISGITAQDYESQFWRHDLYAGTSNSDPRLDAYFAAAQRRYQAAGHSYGGFEKNRCYLNRGRDGFLEAAYLLGLSAEDDCRNAACEDLDGDGRLDLIVTAFTTIPKPTQRLHIFPNFTERVGNWIAVRLRESGDGRSPIGAEVVVRTRRNVQARWLVAGDSYRTQHAPVAHFGLGEVEAVQELVVRWPDGRRTRLDNPGINRAHAVP
jgi:hypothetical protein